MGDELASFMKAADVFVSASYTESFGLAIFRGDGLRNTGRSNRTEVCAGVD